MMFEPNSVVYLFYENHISNAEDVPFHLWKWDMTAMREGILLFQKEMGAEHQSG